MVALADVRKQVSDDDVAGIAADVSGNKPTQADETSASSAGYRFRA
jgi:hypothetical protein